MQVNTDPRFPVKVQRLLLFASMLSDAPTVGDVDLCLQVAAKEPQHYEEQLQALVDAIQAEKGCSYGRALSRAARATHDFVKGNARLLSLHDLRDLAGLLIQRDAPVRVLYEDPLLTRDHVWAALDLFVNLHAYARERGLDRRQLPRVVERITGRPGVLRSMPATARTVPDERRRFAERVPDVMSTLPHFRAARTVAAVYAGEAAARARHPATTVHTRSASQPTSGPTVVPFH